MRQLAEALQYAHSNGVVHRGLNPSGVWCTTTERRKAAHRRVAGRRGSDAPGSVLATHGERPASSDSLEARKPGRGRARRRCVRRARGPVVARRQRVKLDVFALGALTYLLVTGPTRRERHRAQATAGARAGPRPGRRPTRGPDSLRSWSSTPPPRWSASDFATPARSSSNLRRSSASRRRTGDTVDRPPRRTARHPYRRPLRASTTPRLGLHSRRTPGERPQADGATGYSRSPGRQRGKRLAAEAEVLVGLNDASSRGWSASSSPTPSRSETGRR